MSSITPLPKIRWVLIEQSYDLFPNSFNLFLKIVRSISVVDILSVSLSLLLNRSCLVALKSEMKSVIIPEKCWNIKGECFVNTISCLP